MKKHLKGRSLFQLINKKKFNALVQKWDMDKGVRSLTTWELTQALLSCFALRLNSYREVEATLGIADSSFGDAIRHRCSGFFEELCELILLEIRAKTRNRKVKKAIRQILAIDSTEIKVHGSLFNQPGWKQKYCGDAHQAGAKLHIVWDINGEWIDDFVVTPARRHDSPVSLEMRLVSGKTYVFDRAYSDFDFWEKVVRSGSHFVTRLKDCPRNKYLKLKVLSKAKDKDGVLYDGPYKPVAKLDQQRKFKLRQVVYRDPLTKQVFLFVCSNQRIAAQTVADIYRQRWAVELLFRWLKGHLDIRRLPVKTKNAVRTLLAAAVLFQLLLQLKKILSRFQGTLWELLRQIRADLLRKSLTNADVPDGCRWKGSAGVNFKVSTA